LSPIIFIIVADSETAHAELGRRVARRFSRDPDCQTMPNMWAIRTAASPDDVLAYIRQENLVPQSGGVVVATVVGSWAAANAKREPDCWKGSGGLRLSSASGSAVAMPEPYEVP
jgi:hypothetical protein